MTPHNKRERFKGMICRYTRVAAATMTLLLMISEASIFAQSTPGEAMPAAVAKALAFVSSIFSDNLVLQCSKADLSARYDGSAD